MEAVTEVTATEGVTPDDEPMAACLVVIYGEELGRRIEVGTEPVDVGRSASCRVRLDHESVSRRHCQIWFDGRVFRLRDMGSTNGTLLNDAVVDEAELRHGDRLQVGRTVLRFIVGDDVEAQYHEEIYRLMTTDGLTGLHNRRFFDEALERELSRCRRHGRRLSVISLDVDYFKLINDEYGHLAGDDVLRQLGQLLGASVRHDDVVARTGGEEFTLLAPEVGLEGAAEIANKLNRLVAEHRFEVDGVQVPVTVSSGVAEWSEELAGAEELVGAADEKLYQAKRGGRNRVCS